MQKNLECSKANMVNKPFTHGVQKAESKIISNNDINLRQTAEKDVKVEIKIQNMWKN